jgi:hypothetical protein
VQRPTSQRLRSGIALLAALLSGAIALGGVAPAAAQGKPVPRSSTEDGPRWQDLNAAERSVLKPLERDWSSIDASRKQKWRDIAVRHPKLPPAEQARISARMTAWANMSPTERGQARLNYQEARQLPPQDRQARWDAYQQLPPEQKRELATRAVPAAAARSGEVPRRPTLSQGDAGRDAPLDKSNIVPNPAYAAPRKAVAPTVVQAQPGATTTLMSRRPAPPSHQQPGLPKITASPGFVDKSTLLPKRGPQGAAIRSAAASDAKSPPAR